MDAEVAHGPADNGLEAAFEQSMEFPFGGLATLEAFIQVWKEGGERGRSGDEPKVGG